MSKVVETIKHAPASVKVVADTGAISVGLSSFFTDVVPAIASVLSVVWLLLQIYAYFSDRKK